ncbi:SUMF1/EgtB/PvdO family nonheme iron enzyme, partial [Luteitalea sp.]|uniref:SUMF1/EgtB/PvdO family nonheme iron enzyme n=1 Tax=Luteitalea sp. TaxID=2004800 RepID=UPI0025B9671F
EWCLRVWGEESWLASADARLTETEIQQLPDSASSFANQLGQKFVLLGPARFWAGSDNPGLKSLNPRQERTIEHRFAIGAYELQRKYFLACLADMHISGDNSNPLTPSPEMPETALQMFHVGLYCNWLSAQVGLPESEWCFIPGSRTEEGVANYDEQTRLKDNCVDLLGYRVPSELEWEFACRAGTTSETYFGDTREFSLKFAKLETTQAAPGLTQPIGDDVNSYTLHPCGRLKPNGFGLFDMFGNNMEYAVGQASMTQAPGYESVVGFHFLAPRRRITAAIRKAQRGQGLVEYALLLVLIAIASIAILSTLGTSIGVLYSVSNVFTAP